MRSCYFCSGNRMYSDNQSKRVFPPQNRMKCMINRKTCNKKLATYVRLLQHCNGSQYRMTIEKKE